MRNIDAKDGNGLSDEITFQIQINLKNDNGPIRVNDNVLSVVTNGIKERFNLMVTPERSGPDFGTDLTWPAPLIQKSEPTSIGSFRSVGRSIS